MAKDKSRRSMGTKQVDYAPTRNNEAQNENRRGANENKRPQNENRRPASPTSITKIPTRYTARTTMSSASHLPRPTTTAGGGLAVRGRSSSMREVNSQPRNVAQAPPTIRQMQFRMPLEHLAVHLLPVGLLMVIDQVVHSVVNP